MAESVQHPSSIGNDPKRLEWAVEDLADFVGKRWVGDAVVIDTDNLSRILGASRLIVDAIRTEDIILAQPLLDRLGSAESRNKDLEEKIENLRTDYTNELATTEERLTGRIDKLVEERSAYKEGVDTLIDMVESAIGGIEGYENVEDYGNPGFFPFSDLLEDLRVDLIKVTENLPDDEEPEEKNEQAV